MPEKTDILSQLLQKHSRPVKPGDKKLSAAQVSAYLRALTSWKHKNDQISRTLSFKNYYETMAFVNALAWISHEQDHHPDLEVGYNRCTVRYSTHSVGGLSENDFICAAHANELTKI